MPYASVNYGCMQAGPPEWGGEQGWLGLASKLPFCYVIYPRNGDILQNPVVIINSHLPQYDAKYLLL